MREAEAIIQRSEAYKAETIARASGDAQRFNLVYDQYAKAKDITSERIYIETIEDVLRNENPDAITTVASTIRAKADLPGDGDDYGFLADYYAALCAHLESRLMVGRRRENKFS